MKKILIIANWKMNGSVVANSKLLMAMLKFSNSLSHSELVVCPPHIYMHQVKEYIVGSGIKLGAQNVNENDDGAYTGEVSVQMLGDFYCRYCLVGHSERRLLFNESTTRIADKIIRLVAGGLTPVLCIGENLAQRERGEAKRIVTEQLAAIIEIVGLTCFKSVVIAYEPIWAIGTGKTASAEQAQDVHKVIRQYLCNLDKNIFKNLSILYGGSVNENNAGDLIKQSDIDGFLIGGASLKAASLESIYLGVDSVKA
ncbi:MAG: triose-phosphate isomerase [Colwellia sp.]|nr:triose-phosphate isomerase [Colwellia sp.]